MRIGFGYHGIVVDIYYLPGVSVGFAFDVATFGVVNLARRLLCACGDFACDFEHFVGDCSSFGDDNRMRAVFVFEVKPHVVGRCDFKSKFVVLEVVFASIDIKSVHEVNVWRLGFFFAHLIL